MRKLHSDYPVGQLLIAILSESGLNLPDFLRAIGYGNVTKGIRHFWAFLDQGLGSNVLISRLLNSRYAPSHAALTLICQQNMEQVELNLCAEAGLPLDDTDPGFSPFIHAVSSLSAVGPLSRRALAGELAPYTVQIKPANLRLSADEQTRNVGRLVRRNHQEARGVIDFLGPIRYYLYYWSYEKSPLAFSITGEPLGQCDAAFPSPRELRRERRALDNETLQRLLSWRGDLPVT